MLNAKLVIVGGKSKTKEVQLHLPTTIGRGKEADLTIPHALVSRSHTLLFERNGQLSVKDLGSLNGTFVDNQRIESEQIIAPNQLLTLGNITFRAVYEVDHSAKPTRPSDPASLQTVFIDPIKTPTPTTVSVDSEQTIDVETNVTPVVDLAEAPTPRSAISEIDSFDPEEIGSLDEPEAVAPQAPISKNPATSKQTLAAPTQPTLRTPPNPKQPPAQHPPTHSANLPPQPALAADAPIDLGIAEHGIDELGIDELASNTPIAQVSSIQLDLDSTEDRSTTPISFIGNIQTDNDSNSPSIIGDFQIDLGMDDTPGSAIDESQLGSFLKKLPK